jgi:hypothetical protein
MTVLALLAGEAFNGVRVLENTVRLLIMLVGFPLALIAIKFGLGALREGEPTRGWGSLSYGLMVLVPAVGRAMTFDQPINWVTTGLYIAGLVAGGIGLYYRATLSAWWLRRHNRERPDA